jgi:hypothetical protein
MNVVVSAVETLIVGKPTVISSANAGVVHSVIFEDDGTTGYFYACNSSSGERHIVDAVLIYEVEDVTDRHVPCTVQIAWSADQQMAALLINRHSHAVFDFESKQGYCRSGFPDESVDSEWTRQVWADELKARFTVGRYDV